jgi:hypothetical protein
VIPAHASENALKVAIENQRVAVWVRLEQSIQKVRFPPPAPSLLFNELGVKLVSESGEVRTKIRTSPPTSEKF